MSALASPAGKGSNVHENFMAGLSAEGLAFFNSVCERNFADQAIAFLNAYWGEIGSQAEFVFSVAIERFRYADMHAKGVSLIHLYQDGVNLEFNIGLYFYEKLCKMLEDSPKWAEGKWAISQPEMMTAITRKKELRDKVDVNFDGKVSFLEYLLYQYREFANPGDFITRSMATADEHPEITAARRALEAVNKAIQEYEAEKYRLETAAALPGVKGLTAKHTLAQLESGPLMENLNRALITAEAKVRIATKKYGAGGSALNQAIRRHPQENPEPVINQCGSNEGTLWWMNRDLEEKKKRYGKR